MCFIFTFLTHFFPLEVKRKVPGYFCVRPYLHMLFRMGRTLFLLNPKYYLVSQMLRMSINRPAVDGVLSFGGLLNYLHPSLSPFPPPRTSSVAQMYRLNCCTFCFSLQCFFFFPAIGLVFNILPVFSHHLQSSLNTASKMIFLKRPDFQLLL